MVVHYTRYIRLFASATMRCLFSYHYDTVQDFRVLISGTLVSPVPHDQNLSLVQTDRIALCGGKGLSYSMENTRRRASNQKGHYAPKFYHTPEPKHPQHCLPSLPSRRDPRADLREGAHRLPDAHGTLHVILHGDVQRASPAIGLTGNRPLQHVV